MITPRTPAAVAPLWPATRPSLAAVVGADQDWRDDAACREVGPDLFDPAGENERVYKYPKRAAYAAAICGDCPVREACDAYAWASNESGVWGGNWHAPRKGRVPHRATPIAPRTRLPHRADRTAS